MTEKLKVESVSRRSVFSLFGLAVASTLAVPVTVLTVADAEARIVNQAQPRALRA